MSDYEDMLAEVGITEEQARTISENTADRMDIPTAGFYISRSEIAGLGVFAARRFQAGDPIAAARISGKRTQVGRYANHSSLANAAAYSIGDDMYFRAVVEIGFNQEITVNYRQVVALNIAVAQDPQLVELKKINEQLGKLLCLQKLKELRG
jgi:hypothetical protein